MNIDKRRNLKLIYTNECLYKDILIIIEMMDNEMRNKISNSFIEFLIENQDVNFEGTINRSIPIREQQLREEVKLMLSQIYIDYFCSQEKRLEILKLEKRNIENFYSKKMFLKKKQQEIVKQDNIENVDNKLNIIHYRENIFIKILKKVKKFLK